MQRHRRVGPVKADTTYFESAVERQLHGFSALWLTMSLGDQ